MFRQIIPKLPMRDKTATRKFYTDKLGFRDIGTADYDGYLLLQKDGSDLHFFGFAELDPSVNYGQVYIQIQGIEDLYAQYVENGVTIHPNGALENKPWGQKEFSLLDPDNNLLTFGESSL